MPEEQIRQKIEGKQQLCVHFGLVKSLAFIK